MTSENTLVERLNHGIAYLPRTATVGSKEYSDFSLRGDAILVNEGDLWSAVIAMHEAAAELTRLQSLASAAEPVAWQIRFEDDNRWTEVSEQLANDMATKEGWSMRALGVITANPPASASAGEVVVKALEWKEDRDGDGTEIHRTQGGEVNLPYSIYEDGFTARPFGLALNQLRIGSFDSADEAKAAAQADYDRRIRSALTAPPATPAVEITEDMVERACRAHREYWLNLRNKPDEKAAMRPTLAAALAGKG